MREGWLWRGYFEMLSPRVRRTISAKGPAVNERHLRTDGMEGIANLFYRTLIVTPVSIISGSSTR